MFDSVSHAMPRPRFSMRAAAVFLVGLNFLLMLVSGLVVMIAPSGRVAGQIEWTMLGLGRPQWELLHLAGGFLFIGAAVWHIWLHWSVITNLLWSSAAKTLCHRREFALAVGLTLFVIVVAVLGLPPASWLEQLQSWFKRDFW
ncbi:DUF4405 domain-containing protein [Sedimentimonas flavescens]|uniref:DUF4405 domain-containing protein n=1 Tax=Sedimentimonas flavescens TaxID=2851012 RepID=A0ABT2ZY48_9RHOB|nr:DUF4405 domain-containing protein [Sedimentimonas flavescens]MCT2538524.1 DUF4405 domain-containing protein [Sedimentimonas flavescens]MCV2878492.1 DUF4405 domain-containing protein [Sedimentimonas flavescens]